MNRSRLGRVLIVAALMLGLALPAGRPLLAQTLDEPIVAGVDRMSLTTDETLELTIIVTVEGQTSVPRPQVPDLDGFYVVGNSTSQQLSVVNGVASNNVIFRYNLQPYETGTLTIPPTTLMMDGQTYTTDAINIEVTQGTGQPPVPGGSNRPDTFDAPSELNDKELFVEALVDNETPFVGEQIQYIFRYYEAADALRMPSLFASQPDYTPPAMSGFWAEGDTDVVSYRVAVNNRIYTVTELTSILFPTDAGETVIDPAEIMIPGFGFQGDIRLATAPVTVDVQPLPAGAPESFAGAVGNFDITAALDRNQTTVGEPITLQVVLSGAGNIGVAGEPRWPEMENWRAFDTDSTLATRIEDGTVVGTRTFETLLLPAGGGEYTVPPIEYSFFDPVAGSYQTAATEPLTVRVAPGIVDPADVAVQPQAAVEPAAAEAGSPAAEAVAMGLLKPVPETLDRAGDPVVAQPWYWALWVMPLTVLAGGFTWQRRRAYLAENAGAVRASRALKEARRGLNGLRRGAPDESALFAGAYAILTEYLAAKIQRPVIGLTRPALTDLLNEQGADAALIERTCRALDAADDERYSPGGMRFASAGELLTEVESVIADLDTVL